MSVELEQVQMLRAACCVAGIDGDIDEHESEILDALAARIGVGAASLAAMKDRACRDPEFYKEQFKYLTTDPEATVHLLLRVARADGTAGDEEMEVAGRLAEKLGVSRERFDELAAGQA